VLEKYFPVMMDPRGTPPERRPAVWRRRPPAGRVGALAALPEEERLLFYALTLHGEMNAAELDLLFECMPGEGDA